MGGRGSIFGALARAAMNFPLNKSSPPSSLNKEQVLSSLQGQVAMFPGEYRVFLSCDRHKVLFVRCVPPFESGPKEKQKQISFFPSLLGFFFSLFGFFFLDTHRIP